MKQNYWRLEVTDEKSRIRSRICYSKVTDPEHYTVLQELLMFVVFAVNMNKKIFSAIYRYSFCICGGLL
jgi:hypothetical protein